MFLVTSYCWSAIRINQNNHGQQKAYKGCAEVPIKRRVQKYFQNIRCAMEYCECHHQQVETMGHHNDIKTEQDACQNLFKNISRRLRIDLGEVEECRASTSGLLHVTTIFCIFFSWPNRRHYSKTSISTPKFSQNHVAKWFMV